MLTFIVNILYCLVFQMKRWESWEAETRTLEYQFSYGKLSRDMNGWHRYLHTSLCGSI